MSFPGEDILSAAVGGTLSYMGARKMNQSNEKIARKQMDFQERMSNTAYQRTMADMQAAGINPIMAANLGGASTPPGASQTMSNELGAGVSSAVSARAMSAQVAQSKATTDLLKADLPGKQVEAKIWKSKFGELLKALQLVSPSVNSGASLLRAFK